MIPRTWSIRPIFRLVWTRCMCCYWKAIRTACSTQSPPYWAPTRNPKHLRACGKCSTRPSKRNVSSSPVNRNTCDAPVQLRIGRRIGWRVGRTYHRRVHRTGACAHHRSRFVGAHRTDRPGRDAHHAGGCGRKALETCVPAGLATGPMAESGSPQHLVRRREPGGCDAAWRTTRRHRHFGGPPGCAVGRGARLRAEELSCGADPRRRTRGAERRIE